MNKTMTWQQWRAMGDLQFEIAKVDIHPYSGAMTLYGPDKTALVMVNPNGRVTWQAQAHLPVGR